MARIAGRNGRLYMEIASGGTPTPVAFLNKWSLNFSVNKIDVTAFGDGGKVSVAGLPEQSGDVSGFYDDATAQLYTAAVDGLARKFYLYTNTTSNAQYWFGQFITDMSITAAVDGAVEISGTFQNANSVGFTKVG